MRKLVALVVAVIAMALAPAAAQAAIPSVFDGTVACTEQGPGPAEGQVWCGTGSHQQFPLDNRSTVKSFDGVPIDVNVAFPDADGGPYPLVYMFHGYGGGKMNFPAMSRWLDRGYAVFSQTNRGFHESCGTATAKLADPICQEKGFVRLDDTRYEVRDAQLFAGKLVDEGLVQPTKIAATGGSYGGGMSMALAALKDRVMQPDGSLTEWKSPNGTPMSLAVATPDIPWTDLAYSLVPNGSNLDYLKDASYYGPFGVMKQSYVNSLFLGGLIAPGYYTPAGAQPEADLAGWKNFMDAGEPYQGKPQADAMLKEITEHHSSYYIDHSQAPAPLLISSGFTDDLFPANEATRYYNRTRAEHPDAAISLFFGSFGHPRGQNGSEVQDAKADLQNQWVDHYLKGTGAKPASNVTTYTQVCPNGDPDGGPFVTDDWASQSPGEIRVRSAAAQTVSANGGDRSVGADFDPNPAGLNPAPAGQACASVSGAKEPGVASYETAAAPAGGFTVVGAPTVIADFQTSTANAQVAARVVDVAPDGSTKTLVNRGVTRLDGSGLQLFQLQPNAWKVEAGHVLRLELLAFDGGEAGVLSAIPRNFTRPSNGQTDVTVSNLDLRIPVKESPGAADGLIAKPAPRVLPSRPGAALAKGNEAIGATTLAAYTAGKLSLKGAPKVKGKQLIAKVRCQAPESGAAACAAAKLVFKGAPKAKRGKKAKGKGVKLAQKSVKVKAGKTATVRFKLTAKARKLFKDTKKKVRKRGKRKVKKIKGLKKLRTQVLIGGKSSGFVTVKRTGKVR